MLKFKCCVGRLCTIQNKNIWINKKVDKLYMFELLCTLENQSPHNI